MSKKNKIIKLENYFISNILAGKLNASVGIITVITTVAPREVKCRLFLCVDIKFNYYIGYLFNWFRNLEAFLFYLCGPTELWNLVKYENQNKTAFCIALCCTVTDTWLFIILYYLLLSLKRKFDMLLWHFVLFVCFILRFNHFFLFSFYFLFCPKLMYIPYLSQSIG